MQHKNGHKNDRHLQSLLHLFPYCSKEKWFDVFHLNLRIVFDELDPNLFLQENNHSNQKAALETLEAVKEAGGTGEL